jgi:hypothetical protein
LTTLHSFDETDGMYPQAGLVQGTDENVYGVATGTDAFDCWGAVYQNLTGASLRL